MTDRFEDRLSMVAAGLSTAAKDAVDLLNDVKDRLDGELSESRAQVRRLVEENTVLWTLLERARSERDTAVAAAAFQRTRL